MLSFTNLTQINWHQCFNFKIFAATTMLISNNFEEPIRVYFAGKVRKGDCDYRSILFQNDRVMSSAIGTDMELYYSSCKELSAGTVKYWGPSALSCDHGCWHESDHGIVNPFDNTRHWQALTEHFHYQRESDPKYFTYDSRGREGGCPDGHREDNGLSRKQAVERCKFQIMQAEALYAYIDANDCYGTLIEIGFANAIGIPVHLVFSKDLFHCEDKKSYDSSHGWCKEDHDDFWFVKEMATSVSYGHPSKGLEYIACDRPSRFGRNAWKRVGIKPKQRVQVLARDNYTCKMCGASRSEGAILEIDHIHPVSKGGTNDLSNLQVLCRDCNAGKGNEILFMP